MSFYKLFFGFNFEDSWKKFLGKFEPKGQSCPFWLKIDTILNSFLGRFGKKKSESCFTCKLTYRVSRGCWFLFRQQFSEFPTLSPVFGQIWAENVKAVCFVWKLTHKHTHTHTHIHTHTNTQTPIHTHRQYLEDGGSYFDIVFLKFRT